MSSESPIIRWEMKKKPPNHLGELLQLNTIQRNWEYCVCFVRSPYDARKCVCVCVWMWRHVHAALFIVQTIELEYRPRFLFVWCQLHSSRWTKNMTCLNLLSAVCVVAVWTSAAAMAAAATSAIATTATVASAVAHSIARFTTKSKIHSESLLSSFASPTNQFSAFISRLLLQPCSHRLNFSLVFRRFQPNFAWFFSFNFELPTRLRTPSTFPCEKVRREKCGFSIMQKRTVRFG